MKKLFYISIVFSTVLFSCKFRTPKSEREKQENSVVEQGELITIRTSAIVFNNSAMDKDFAFKDTTGNAIMALKYVSEYENQYGANYEIVSTKCTDLRIIEDSIEVKYPPIRIGSRDARMVIFQKGMAPFVFKEMLGPKELAVKIREIEILKKMTPSERENKLTEDSLKLIRDSSDEKVFESAMEEKKNNQATKK
jgi:hypothetical protein